MPRLVTRAQYLEIVDRHFQSAKDDAIARIRSLPRKIFLAMSARRFDESVEKYGGPGVGDVIDLDAKNFPQDMQEEIIDLLDYSGLQFHKRSLK